jgi:hypothetical protein
MAEDPESPACLGRGQAGGAHRRGWARLFMGAGCTTQERRCQPGLTSPTQPCWTHAPPKLPRRDADRRMRAHTHTPTHTHTHTQTHTHIDTHTQVFSPEHRHAHAHINRSTHTQRHIRTHTASKHVFALLTADSPGDVGVIRQREIVPPPRQRPAPLVAVLMEALAGGLGGGAGAGCGRKRTRTVGSGCHPCWAGRPARRSGPLQATRACIRLRSVS